MHQLAAAVYATISSAEVLGSLIPVPLCRNIVQNILGLERNETVSRKNSRYHPTPNYSMSVFASKQNRHAAAQLLSMNILFVSHSFTLAQKAHLLNYSEKDSEGSTQPTHIY